VQPLAQRREFFISDGVLYGLLRVLILVIISNVTIASDIAILCCKRDVKLQLTN